MSCAVDTDKIKVMQLTVDLYRMYIEESKRLIPIIQKFDGKQVNVRINKAFNNEFDNDNVRAIYSIKYNSFEINLYAKNDIVTGLPDKNGIAICYYANNRSECISTKLTDANNPDNSALINNRINSEAIITSINRTITYWMQEAYEIEKCIEQFNEIEQKYNAICAEIAQFKNSINYQFRSLLNFDFKNIY